MIELALKTALERLTGLDVYPLLLPDELQEGITYQCISDPELYAGLLRTGLIAGRFQIAIHLLNDYTRLLQLDKKISAMDRYRAWPAGGLSRAECGPGWNTAE